MNFDELKDPSYVYKADIVDVIMTPASTNIKIVMVFNAYLPNGTAVRASG